MHCVCKQSATIRDPSLAGLDMINDLPSTVGIPGPTYTGFPQPNLYHKEATLLTYTKKEKIKKKKKKKEKERQLYAARNDKVKVGELRFWLGVQDFFIFYFFILIN
jgi:hypothetical protein